MNKKELKIGLALGSGGYRGLAHIGVLKVLEKNNIKISHLSGSSIGGLVAAYYSVFESAEKLEEEIMTWPMESLYKFIDLSWTGGVISGKKFSKFLENKFTDLVFSQTKIPLKILTTNLVDGRATILSSGKIIEAIRATISVPLMFKPYKLGDKLLVDGALSSPVPVNLLKEKGLDIVIAVNLYHDNEFVKRNFSMPKIAIRSMRIALYNLARNDVRNADVVISPDTSEIIIDESFKKYNFSTVKKLIEIGEKSALRALPKIKELLENAKA